MTDVNATESAYRRTTKERRHLQFTLVSIVTVYYFSTIICVNFTSLLDGPALGSITWAYLVTYSQFAVAVVVTVIYRSRIGVIERRFAKAIDTSDNRGDDQ